MRISNGDYYLVYTLLVGLIIPHTLRHPLFECRRATVSSSQYIYTQTQQTVSLRSRRWTRQAAGNKWTAFFGLFRTSNACREKKYWQKNSNYDHFAIPSQCMWFASFSIVRHSNYYILVPHTIAFEIDHCWCDYINEPMTEWSIDHKKRTNNVFARVPHKNQI